MISCRVRPNMTKSFVVLFVVLVPCFLFVQAQRLRCRPQCRRFNSGIRASACIIEDDGINCRRLMHCQVREENCRRQSTNQPFLRQTSIDRCQTIQTMDVPGRCAGIPCSALRCTDTVIGTSCFRNPGNQCQLLTQCQQQRLNCEVGPQNIFTSVDATRCTGMRAGDALAICQP